MKLTRRIAIVISAAYCSPFFLLGFIWQVAENWFSFGRECAEQAGDEWINPAQKGAVND